MRFLILLSLLFSSCYSFKGISIAPEVKTYFVAPFEDATGQLPVGFSDTYVEILSRKVRSETNLRLNDSNPDVTFSGNFVSLDIRSEDADQNNQATINKLYVILEVTYVNIVEEKEWTEKFQEVESFDVSVNYLDVQDQLLNSAMDKINDKIFNKAFTDW